MTDQVYANTLRKLDQLKAELNKLQQPLSEVLQWHPASSKPDTDTTVLLHVPEANEPVWLGFWDSETDCWRYVSSLMVTEPVTHWAHLPEGPKA